MADQLFMDVPAVKEIATRFDGMGDKLKQTSSALEVAITALKASAFVGLFGNAALANYLEGLKPQIDGYAEKCGRMSSALVKAAEAYENGDMQAAAHFELE